jgi:hypothetical protein
MGDWIKEFGVWIGGMALAGLIWGLRLESRVNVIEALRKADSDNLESRLDILERNLVERLARIERKQDAQNGHSKADN